MVYVTHDQSEALTLGDRIAILRDGVLQQVASPMELYARPANRFVAAFIGSPAMNFFDGELHPDSDGEGGGRFTFNGSGLTIGVRCDAPPANRVTLGVRPHHLEVVGEGEGSLRAEVAVVEPMGNEQIVYATLPGGKRVVALAPPEPAIKPESMVAMRVRSDAVHVFDAATGTRVSCRGA
jgi:multiple sugar transport system ATP-binding protein